MILAYFSKVKYSILNHTAANAHSGVMNANTVVLRVAPQPETSLQTAANAHSSVTIASSSVMKAIFAENCMPNRHMYERHLKVVLSDSVSFVSFLHSIALPLKKMLRCLPSTSLSRFSWSGSIQIRFRKFPKLCHAAFRRMYCPFLLYFTETCSFHRQYLRRNLTSHITKFLGKGYWLKLRNSSLNIYFIQ